MTTSDDKRYDGTMLALRDDDGVDVFDEIGDVVDDAMEKAGNNEGDNCITDSSTPMTLFVCWPRSDTSTATVLPDDGIDTCSTVRFLDAANANSDATVIDTWVVFELKVIVRLTIDVLDNSNDVSDDDTAPNILLIASRYCDVGKLLFQCSSSDSPFNTNDGCDVGCIDGWEDGCLLGCDVGSRDGCAVGHRDGVDNGCCDGLLDG